MILFWFNVTPVTEEKSRLRFVVQLNLGGSIPQRIREVISKKQAGFIDILATMIRDNPQEFEASYTQHIEAIDRNIQTQKQAVEDEARAAEEKLKRKEARKQAKLDARREEAKQVADAVAVLAVAEVSPAGEALPEATPADAAAAVDSEDDNGDYMGGMTERKLID